MPLDVHGPNDAILREVHAEDTHLLGTACDLFASIFPEDRRHISYVRASALGRHPSHPNTLDHVWLVGQGGEWVGLRMFSFITTRDFGYGAYTGFVPGVRGQGLGSWLIGLVHAQLDKDARMFGKPGSIGFIGEVARPIDCKTDEEWREAERRLRFHRRVGGIVLPVPFIEPVMIELGEPTHPFGAKGCSEISYVGVAPAIANAIYNATGVRMTELPMTPERVLKGLRDANRSAA